MTRTLVILAAIATLFAGCAQTDGKTNANPPAGSNADPSTTTSDKPADAESSSAAPKNPTFGQAYTWDDGLTLKVSKPKPFKPSEYAATGGKGQAIKFTFTIVNKTDKPYDPSLFYATLQSGNAEAQDIFDSENGLGGSPSTKVLPGREVKFDQGWTVKNPKDLVLEVSPDAGIEYESVIFSS